MQTSAREHAGHIFTKKLDVGEDGGLKINGTAVTATAANLNALAGITASAADLNTLAGASAEAAVKCQGGFLTVTGTGTVTSTLATISSVVAVLGANAAITGTYVTATKSGLVITLSVWMPTSTSNPTPIASTTPVQVNWIATGT